MDLELTLKPSRSVLAAFSLARLLLLGWRFAYLDRCVVYLARCIVCLNRNIVCFDRCLVLIGMLVVAVIWLDFGRLIPSRGGAQIWQRGHLPRSLA